MGRLPFVAFVYNCIGETVPFGETLLFKALASKSRQRKGGRRLRKADSAWDKGIWVGKVDNNDEHIVLTPIGKTQCRTVRRLEASRCHDQDLFGKVLGLHWEDRLLAVKGQAKQLVVPTADPEVADPMLNESKSEVREVEGELAEGSVSDGSSHSSGSSRVVEARGTG